MVYSRICAGLVLAVMATGARAAAPAAPVAGGAGAPRVTLNFDKGWRFFKGEPPAPASTQPANGNYPPIDPPSHAYKDDAWRVVDLPHDWSIEGPFDENAPSGAAGAFLPTGVSWYRKTFTVPAEAKGKRVFIEFDGVMANSEVYINKGLLGLRPNGYVGFRYELTDYLDFAGPNVMAVRTDTSRQPASRWYAGAGIYRHVRLVIQNPVHIEAGATFVTTLQVNTDRAIVHIRTAVMNQSTTARDVALEVMVTGREGEDITPIKLPAKHIAAGAMETFEQDVTVGHPNLWEPGNPFLFHADIRAFDGTNLVDAESVPFGIRTAEFKADTGFWLNGKNMKLLGVALHQDAGALGVAVPASAWESRLAALKRSGVNAIRAGHAPMPPEFYDVCDRLGLLVMDEAFDAWTVGKVTADYHLFFKDWWQRDLAAMITAHRNHPSIVIYSLGNEIWDILPQNPDPALDQFTGPMRSIDIAKGIAVSLRDYAHQLDGSRPVTLAVMRPNVNHTYDNGFSEIVDVVGQNYRDAELAAAHKANPARKIIGTESYKTREAWLALRDNPALAGQFLWSGADYLGEAGKWPNIITPSGIIDRTNFPKGEALEREAWWVQDRPVLHIARMRSIPTRPGAAPVLMGFADWTPTDAGAHAETVSAYSNCDEVELFINDQSLGSKPKDKNDAPRQWQVPFAAGTLRAVARNGGKEVATDALKTAGAPTKVILKAERATLPNDWDDVVYVRALLVDANGTLNPNAGSAVTFKASGAGKIIAVDNGAPDDHDPFQSDRRRAFQGTCVAIVRATADSGAITITATADGLAEGSTTIEAAPAAR